MYQSVILLLVTMVTTIITTVVTVRLTMTGRVVSQQAKDRFRTTARRYGMLLLYLFGLTVNTYSIVRFMRRTAPIDRLDIVLVSLAVCLGVVSLLGIALIASYALVYRQLMPLPIREADGVTDPP